MYDFLLQTSFFVSLGIVIYLLARAVPRVHESGDVVHAPGRFDRLLSKLPLQKIDARLNVFLEKFLRRAKVILMKFDNSINYHLGRLRKSNNVSETEKKPDLFQEVNSDKKENNSD